jgi:hypothetical protein
MYIIKTAQVSTSLTWNTKEYIQSVTEVCIVAYIIGQVLKIIFAKKKNTIDKFWLQNFLRHGNSTSS